MLAQLHVHGVGALLLVGQRAPRFLQVLRLVLLLHLLLVHLLLLRGHVLRVEDGCLHLLLHGLQLHRGLRHLLHHVLLLRRLRRLLLQLLVEHLHSKGEEVTKCFIQIR